MPNTSAPACVSLPPSRAWRARAADLGVFAGWIVALSVLPACIALTTWGEVRALRQAWTIAGPPCPVVAAPARWAVGARPPRTFTFGGVTYARSFGAADCQAIPEDGLVRHGLDRVCQFNNPGVVRVTWRGRDVLFQPPVGRRATVVVRRGRLSCVVGGWFDY